MINKRICFYFELICLVLLLNNYASAEQFNDPGVRDIVLAMADSNQDYELSKRELESITELDQIELRSNEPASGFGSLLHSTYSAIQTLDDLRFLPNLEKLCIADRIKSLEGIQYAKNLRELQLGLAGTYLFNVSNHDYYYLATLPKLESLALQTQNGLSYTFLSRMKQLKKLYIYETGGYGTGLESINDLTELEELHIIGASASSFANIDFSNFPHLKCLAIETNDIEDKLQELIQSGAAQKIERLALYGPITDETLSLIAQMENLEMLDLDSARIGYGQVPTVNFSQLETCRNLRTLVLSSFNTSDYDQLSKLQQVQDLRIFGSFKHYDLRFCKKMVNLESLIIHSIDGGFYLSSLNGLSNLRSLELRSDEIELFGIDNLNSLETFRYNNQARIEYEELKLDVPIHYEKYSTTLMGYYYSTKKCGEYGQFYIFDR